MNRNKQLLLFVLVFILCVGFYVFNNLSNESSDLSKIDIRKFQGSVVNIEGNAVTLHGVFNGTDNIPDSLSSPRNFTFLVDSSTDIKKLELEMPSYESLRASGKTSRVFDVKDLPKKEGAGSLEDLSVYAGNQSASVGVTFSEPISNSKNSVASSVFYQILKEPAN